MSDHNQTTNKDQAIREITVGGTVEESVVVNGNNNVVNVNALAPQDDNGPAFRVLTVVARALDVSELPDIADAWSLADGLRADPQQLEKIGVVARTSKTAAQRAAAAAKK